MHLINRSTHSILFSNLMIADSLMNRMVGLLKFHSLNSESALWIKRCNSIHTWFMKFSIDVVFVDRQLKVKAIFCNVQPWRLIWPVWSARSVIEMAAGQITAKNIQLGDQFDVGR